MINTVLLILPILSLVISFLMFLWTIYKYNDTKKREQDLKEFDNYHKLIKELVQPDDSNSIYVDRQTAIIYELRHLKRYYDFSYRTLIGLREKWGKVPDQYPRLIEELDLSIEFLKGKI